MALQKNLGENDEIDSGVIPEDEVSYVPSEIEVESSEEKSDAQRIADGEIDVSNGESEIFVSANSVYVPPTKETEEPEEEEETSEEETPKEEPKEKEAPQEEEEVEAKPVEEEKKPASAPDKVQKRINKITREKYEAQRKAEALEKRLLELETKFKEVEFEKAKVDLASTKPIVDDFEDDASYHEALGRWAAKMEIHDSKATIRAKEPAKEEPIDPVQRIIEVGKESYPDFEDLVLREDLKITPLMIEAAKDSDYASDIFYHLGQHPELATKISGFKSPAAVAREIGRIELKFIGEEVPEVYEQTVDMDSEVIEKSKPKPKKTNIPAAPPPPPVKPLGGSGKTSVSLDRAGFDDYATERGYTRDGSGGFIKKRYT